MILSLILKYDFVSVNLSLINKRNENVKFLKFVNKRKREFSSPNMCIFVNYIFYRIDNRKIKKGQIRK